MIVTHALRAPRATGAAAILVAALVAAPSAFADPACDTADGEAPTEAGCEELTLGAVGGAGGWFEVHLVDRPWGGLPGRIEIASVETNERREVEIRLRRSATHPTTSPSRFVLGVHRGHLRVVAPEGERLARIAPFAPEETAVPLPAVAEIPFRERQSLGWPARIEVAAPSWLDVELSGRGECSACVCPALVGRIDLEDEHRVGLVLLPEAPDERSDDGILCAALPNATASARMGPLAPGAYEIHAAEQLTYRLVPVR